MRNILLTVFILSVQQIFSQSTFVIEGDAPDLLNNKKIYLVVQDLYSSNRSKQMDSCVVIKNHFSFKGYIKRPAEMAFITTKDRHYLAYFVVELGNNKMRIGEVLKNSPTFKNKLSNTSIQNSVANKVFKEIDNLISEYYLKYGKPSTANKNILELDSAIMQKMRSEQLGILRSYPDCFYSLIHLYRLFNQTLSGPGEIIPTYHELSNELKNSELGKELWLKINASQVVLIGNKVRQFSANTDTGSIFLGNSLDGKNYLLAFGATWCQPCKENFPLLKILYNKYRNKGFEIVYVNLDDKEALWKQQIKQYKMVWRNISELKKWEESTIVKEFNIQAVPFYLIIDSKGIIIYNSFQLRDFGYKKLETYILNCLASN